MATYEAYTPDTFISRALFNFDAFGGSDFRVTGPISVSVSDSFTLADFKAQAVSIASEVYTTGSTAAGGWTPSNIANVDTILQIYANFIPVNFSKVIDDTGLNPAQVGASSDVDIALINRPDLAFSGYASLNNDLLFLYPYSRSDIVVNVANTEANPSFSTLAYSGHVLMHEIGHVLGMSHPQLRYIGSNAILTSDFIALTEVGFDQLGFVIQSGIDLNKEYFTIMSYADQVPAGGNTFAQTPMILDVIALQTAYGEGHGSSGSGNDIITPGDAGQVTSFRTYFDTGGTDTINLENYAGGAYLHMGAVIDGASHLVGVSMSTADEALMRNGANPESLRWFYGEFENAVGSAGDDHIIGNMLDNVITGGGGNDIIDGGAGIDTALYSGKRSDYLIDTSNAVVKVSDQVAGRDGQDQLTNIEILGFSDGKIVLDADAANAGDLYLFFSGLFGRVPDTNGFRYWAQAAAMQALSEDDVARIFTASAEYSNIYAGLSDKDFASALYSHVFGRNADVAGLAYWTQALSHGTTRLEVETDFVTSAEALAVVGPNMRSGFWTI